jgi:V8-like Glu-specific endopeptidase
VDSLCGGTIVNKRYVVTAAHCLFKDGDQPSAMTASSPVKVMMGEHSWCDGVTNEGGKYVTASAVITHPSYAGRTTNFDNDIAVLKLSEDITFTAHVKPACLPTSATKDYSGLASTISGWGGTTQYAPWQSVTQPNQCGLKESVVKVLSPSSSKCSSFLKTSSSTNRLCAWAEGTDTCQGDSGGPLTVAEGGKYVLLGVTSNGAGCAHTTPGVYARVQGFLPWLQAIIADGECGSRPTTSPAPSATSGYLQSDNYPQNYPNGQHKTYTITAPTGKVIDVWFYSFVLEADQGTSCAYDYLMAMDGDGSVLMKKKCGATKPAKFTSKTNKVTIIFHSDSSVTAKGFKLSWDAHTKGTN